MPLTNGSGSAYFAIGLQDANKKQFKKETFFSAYCFLKVQNESQNRRNQGFPTIFA
jgi:hypothetical protein